MFNRCHATFANALMCSYQGHSFRRCLCELGSWTIPLLNIVGMVSWCQFSTDQSGYNLGANRSPRRSQLMVSAAI